MRINFKEKSLWKIVGFVFILIIISVAVYDIWGNKSSKVYAKDLMDNVKAQKPDSVKLTDSFINTSYDFSIDMMKNNISRDKNSLISPMSIYLALGMTANGSDGNTLKEFENILSKNKLSITELNKSYYSLISNIKTSDGSKLNIANSIWYSKNFPDIKKEFLQTNANYYGANAYSADFSSPKTVTDINNWVNNNTDGLIKNIIDKINKDSIMYLINTVLFDAKWARIYEKSDIKDGQFNLENKSKVNCKFMSSKEGIYLKDDLSTGFIKPYKGNKFSFAAILPNEDVGIDNYLQKMTGENILNVIKTKKSETVITSIPKFKYSNEMSLVNSLNKIGLNEAFSADKANFKKMSSTNGIYIGEVLHKTYIQVDEVGTKAGAVTSVEMKLSSAPVGQEVILDRPFIYAIIDNSTSLPIFIGVVKNPTLN